jgi:hypothetical protein
MQDANSGQGLGIGAPRIAVIDGISGPVFLAPSGTAGPIARLPTAFLDTSSPLPDSSGIFVGVVLANVMPPLTQV